MCKVQSQEMQAVLQAQDAGANIGLHLTSCEEYPEAT
jgi:hypothetical protein